MEDYIDIVDQNGNLTGHSAPKSVIHSKGHYHNTAHLWLYTSDGHILLQQRSATKAICPLLWDVSVAGHIDAGETPTQGIIRETKEEIGLNIHKDKLKKIGIFDCFQSYDNGIIDNEFHHTFICQIEVSTHDLIPQKNEVEALKYISIQGYQHLLDHIGIDNHFVPSNKSYYEFVLKTIINQLK